MCTRYTTTLSFTNNRVKKKGGGGLISFPHLFIQYVHCLQCNIENKGLKMKLTCKLTPPLLSEHQPRCDSYEVLQCNALILEGDGIEHVQD